MGVHWKIGFLEGEFTKNQYIERNYVKGKGAWKICRLKRGLGEKKVVFLRGGWYPYAQYDAWILPLRSGIQTMKNG